MSPWIAAVPAAIGFAVLVGVAVRDLWAERREQRWRQQAAQDGDDGGRHALDVRLPAGGGAPVLEAWWEVHDETVYPPVAVHGTTYQTPPSREIRVAVTWPDAEPTANLRDRVATADPRLQGLVAYLAQADNSFAPNDRGFCHAAWDLPFERIEAIANNFVDLAWLLCSDPDEAIAALIVRAARGEVPAGGVGFRALFRHAGAFAAVRSAAPGLVDHADNELAFAALRLTGGPMEAILEFAHRDGLGDELGLAVARFAIEHGALDEFLDTLSLLSSAAPAWGPVLDAYDGLPPEELRTWMLRVVEDAPVGRVAFDALLQSARAFAHWTDDRTAALLLRWYGSEAPTLARAAADSLASRQLPAAATQALAMLFADGPLPPQEHLQLIGACGELSAVESLLEARTRLPRTLHPDVDRAIARIQDRCAGGEAGGLSVVDPGGQLSVAHGGELALEPPAPRRPERSKA